MSQNLLDSLTPEHLVQFAAGLSSLAPEEARRAKAMLIHDAIAEYKADKKRGEGWEMFLLMISFLLIPLPFWFLVNSRNDARQELYLGRIRGAISFWRADLQVEEFDAEVRPRVTGI
jgi:hypothetical protein